ncbi:hypothetical protein [Acidicapsa acidisoli]|uniref:hypothetical protein n=1 Tax=Acidicapsa acidisoli TaxID=1615681 RepID=UPI0021DF87A1|nr:hypothetical protein [Acidicapsa acidisoli]
MPLAIAKFEPVILMDKEVASTKAAVVNILGHALEFQDFLEPVAGDGEAIIQMHAAGLHPVVKAIANGQHYSSRGQRFL